MNSNYRFLLVTAVAMFLTAAYVMAQVPDMNSMMAGMNMSGMNTSATGTPMSGMDMSGMNMSGMNMADMQPIASSGVPDATETTGAQPLAYTMEDGYKVFELTAEPVRWKILDDVTVTAWTYNGTVPGPLIRVTQGDKVRIRLTNHLPEDTTIHWHGLLVPNSMDGVPGVTQDPVAPGQTFTYEFTVDQAGTFMYHSHVDEDKQVSVGLYGPLIVDPASPDPALQPTIDVPLMISEWRVINDQTYASMPMAGMDPNYFTINGKAYPDIPAIHAKVGDRILLRVMDIGQFVHPMHLHGLPFNVIAEDGHTLPSWAQLTLDTVSVSPGQRYDLEFTATEPGVWMFHCHIAHHTTNNGDPHGGLMMLIYVDPSGASSPVDSSGGNASPLGGGDAPPSEGGSDNLIG